eukprot:scaffold13283_cov82-Cyclotella_meneghiniana.AAC.5
MGAPHVVVIVLGVGVVAAVGYRVGLEIYSRWSKRRERQDVKSRYSNRERQHVNYRDSHNRFEENQYQSRYSVRHQIPVRRGNRNNHDHQKRQYRSQCEAEEVILKMRMQGQDDEGTLRSYYNPDYDAWFVGNSYQ